MPSNTFPNGNGTLDSSALTPVAFQTLLQPLIAEILGIDPVLDPDKAFNAVRVGWQQEGQPAWLIGEDICILRATLNNDPFARVRDNLYFDSGSPPDELINQMGFTQVWTLHLTLYGPNCEERARLILSAMALEWVHDELATSSIYRIPTTARPHYVPENFQGQWWLRTDVEIEFNELVIESLTVPSAAGVDVTVETDDGLTTEIQIGTT